MPQYNDVEVVTLDGQPYAVSGMSSEIQNLMELYNDWSRRAFDIQQELQMVGMARDGLSQKIGAQFQSEQAAAAEAAQAKEAAAAAAVAPDPGAVAPAPEVTPTQAASNE